MSDKEQKESKSTKDSNTEEEESVEDFMKKMYEYHEKLNKEEEFYNESEASNYDVNEVETEIDNLMQKIELLKEELIVERGKVKTLSEVVKKQNEVIETLQKTVKTETQNTDLEKER